MRKREEYNRDKAIAPANQRIDALAAALGYDYVDGLYVRKATRTERREVRIKQIRNETGKRHNRYFPHFSVEVYNRLSALGVAQMADLTEDARLCKIKIKQVKNRVALWSLREHPSRKYYAYREDGHILVTRIA